MKKEKIVIYSPQWDRPFEIDEEKFAKALAAAASDKNFFTDLYKNYTDEELYEIGFCQWEEDSDLRLVPGEFYDLIPDGVPIVDIFGFENKFKKGKTDDDIRFGCLSFGIKR